MDKTTSVVRVAVNNNFNCTPAEFKQLDTYTKQHPDKLFFINTNIKTPKLLNINNHPYSAVITVNPDISVDRNLVERLYGLDPSKIAFTRVKYIPEHQEIIDLIQEIDNKHTVVITLQRFNSIKTITKYVPNFRDHYKHTCNRFRLVGDSLKLIEKLADSNRRTFICDRAGLGCQGCGLCSEYTIGNIVPIYSLNLSASGICPYSCCDCYAKTMQHFLKGIGKPMIRYDYIHRNHKQAGRTEHIKNTLKKVADGVLL